MKYNDSADKKRFIKISSIKKVEGIIKSSQLAIKERDINKLLSDYVPKEEVSLVLRYLELQNKIYSGEKGIIWIKPSPKMQERLKEMVKLNV